MALKWHRIIMFRFELLQFTMRNSKWSLSAASGHEATTPPIWSLLAIPGSWEVQGVDVLQEQKHQMRLVITQLTPPWNSWANSHWKELRISFLSILESLVLFSEATNNNWKTGILLVFCLVYSSPFSASWNAVTAGDLMCTQFKIAPLHLRFQYCFGNSF